VVNPPSVDDDDELDPQGKIRDVMLAPEKNLWEKIVSTFSAAFHGGKSKMTRKRLHKKNGNATRHKMKYKNMKKRYTVRAQKGLKQNKNESRTKMKQMKK